MYILILLCFSGAGCDWVEISQNHYRKEYTRPVNTHVDVEESTTAIAVYRDHSVLDKHRKKGVVDRVQNVANIKRVHIPTVKTPSFHSDETILNSRDKQEQKHSYFASKSSFAHHHSSLSKYPEEELPSKTDHIHRENSFEKNPEVSTVLMKQNSKIDKKETVTKPFTTNTINKKNIFRNVNEENPTLPTFSNKPIRKTIDFVESLTSPKHTTQISYQERIKELNAGVRKESVTKESFLTTHTTNRPALSTINIPHEETIAELDGYIKNLGDHDEKKQNNKEEEVKPNSEDISHKTKGSTRNTVWKLLKLVTDTIASNTKKGFKSKVTYLENLKNKILSSIEDHVERTWPDDKEHSSRHTRDTGRGHVEFPSSEGALMSISFLTFAVFLIKLVLQVIHTYKNKTMMVTPAVVTAVGRAAAAMKSKTP